MRFAARRSFCSQYYTTDEIAQAVFPQGITRFNIGSSNLSDEQIAALVAQVRCRRCRADLQRYEHTDEFTEYLTYMSRIEQR